MVHGSPHAQLLDSSTAAICLTLAEGAAVFTVSSFLRSLHPSPSLSLLTGTCSAPLSLAAGGDVVLVGRSKAVSALPAQLQHSTALDVWRLGRRERYSQPTAEKSEFEQVLWLTRLHAELQVRGCGLMAGERVWLMAGEGVWFDGR